MLRAFGAAVLVTAVVAGAAGAVPFAGGNGLLLATENGDVFTVSPGGERRAVATDGWNAFAVFSPDGSRIAYAKGSLAPPISVVVRDTAAGSPERTVWAHTEAVGSGGIESLKWSPDGRHIGYVVRGGGIYVLDVDGGGPPHRVDDAPHGFDWSPDGRELVYSLGDVFIQAATRGPRATVVDGPTMDVEPRFSPDGSRVAFLRLGENGGIYTIGRDARNAVFVGAGHAGNTSAPAWSPDGNRITFGGWTTARGTNGVFVARADGSGAALARQHVRGARFSPDGARLLLESSSRLSQEEVPQYLGGVFVMNADGRCLTYLGPGFAVDWQPLPGVAPPALARCVDVEVGVLAPRLTAMSGYVQSLHALNTGTDVSGEVVLTQTFNADVRIVKIDSRRGPCTATARVLRCRFASLTPGLSAQIDARVLPVDPGVLTSTIDASVDGADSDPTSNTATTTTRVSPCLRITPAEGGALVGTSRGERLCGLGGRDFIDGRGGADVLLGGHGPDEIVGGGGRDVIDGEGGNDLLRARDGQRDEVWCGGGKDEAITDRIDFTRQCERVRRG